MYIIESFQEFKDELILEEFLNINLDGIKKKLKNMIGKNRIKINIKDIKTLMNKLGLKKGMNVKQIYSKLKSGKVDDIVNNIANQANGNIDSKDSELVSESFLNVSDFFQKNKWAKYLFVAFLLMTIFSAKSLANVNQTFDNDNINIELDGDDGDSVDLTPNHPKVIDVDKNSDGSYEVKVKLTNSNLSRLSNNGGSQAGLIAGGEVLHHEGLEKADITRTIVNTDYHKLPNGQYEGEFTIKVNLLNSSDNSKTTSSPQYLQSILGDDDI
jgi:hypothetical protein